MNILGFDLPFSFTDPWWLVAFAGLPALLALGLWQGPGGRTRYNPRGAGDRWRPRTSTLLRAAIVSLVLLALAGLQVVQSAGPWRVVYLVDVSDSVSAAQQAAALAYVTGGLRAKGGDDQVGVVLFGDGATVARLLAPGSDLALISGPPRTGATDIAGAVQLGLALLPPGGRQRLVLLSDGVETAEGARAAAARAGVAGVPIDVVPYTREATREVAVAGVGAPHSIPQGQQFDLTVVVQSDRDTTAHLQVFQDDTSIGERDVPLKAQTNNTFTFPVTPKDKGFHTYRADVSALDDHFTANNTLAGYTFVLDVPQVLIVVGTVADGEPLKAALAAAHVDSDIVGGSGLPKTVEQLRAYDAVVLANVGSEVVGVEAQQALQSYVRDLGRGLLMIGGEASFGAGGYLRSPLEEALPVTMDVRGVEREQAVALALVVDKSGSMGRCHCGNSGAFRSTNVQETGVAKTEIAKEAIIKTAATLSAKDRIGVVTFDRLAQWVVNMQPVRDVPDLPGTIANITADGTTNIYAGLRAATDALEATDAPLKHIILLSDGWASLDPNDITAGAEQEGQASQASVAAQTAQYDTLLTELNARGITLSTIAAGARSSDVLSRLAEVGKGRFYGAVDENSIPQLFLRETSLVGGAYLIEKPFVPTAARASPILKGIDPGTLPPLLGYNNSTARGTAEVVLASPDGNPILAQWQYGLGRSVAWTSDLKGRWARDWVTWEGFPTFAAQMVGWTLPRATSSGLVAEVQTAAGRSTIRINSTDINGAPRNSLQTLVQVRGPDGSTSEVLLPQYAPGRYEGEVRTAVPGAYSVDLVQKDAAGAVMAEQSLGLVVPYAPEYRLDAEAAAAGRLLLTDIAAASGGRVLTLATPADAFTGMVPARSQRVPLWPWLLTVALLLFPFDVAVRRLTLTRRDVIRGVRALRMRRTEG